MAKRSKIQTPEWVLKGEKGPTKKKTSSKVYKVKECPKCKSDDVAVVLSGEEGKVTREWECKKCKWTGRDIQEKELSEDEFLELMEKKG